MNIVLQSNDKCPCESGSQFGNCCNSNPFKMWFINRIGCRLMDERTKEQIIISDFNHAIGLYLLASDGESFKDLTN